MSEEAKATPKEDIAKAVHAAAVSMINKFADALAATHRAIPEHRTSVSDAMDGVLSSVNAFQENLVLDLYKIWGKK